MNDLNLPFREIWLVDFEFSASEGNRPVVICLVAREFLSGRQVRVWQDELTKLAYPPYPCDESSLFVAYYSSAEFNCHLVLGWPLPVRVLDLFCEFRNLTNGLSPPCGSGLLGALAWHGLPSIEAAEKDNMRALAMRGGPWSGGEKAALLDYCASDVDSLAKLLPRMRDQINVPLALQRGRYMVAAARIEYTGIPMDLRGLFRLREHWSDIQDELICAIDGPYQVYENRSFKKHRFADFLIRHDIPWPRLASGDLDLSDATFKDMSRAHPILAPLRELRVALSQMRLSELAVGIDGRNRTLLSAFRSRTGRNQPSNTKAIFGPSVWLRGLIKPGPGFGLAYIDWSQQEFGIAAALSGDALMMDAYHSGDPYLAFAIQAGLVPPDANKQSHPAEREQCKACVLAVQYGMGAEALALRLGQPVIRARELLRLHRETYRVFWQWVEGAVDYAMLHGKLWTVFGWTIQVGAQANPRFLQNFLMQANGSEMLRLATCLVTEAGISVCAPIHDAILIEAPLDQLDEVVSRTQCLMSDASAVVLNGFRLRSDAKTIRSPDRYMDERGEAMWSTVIGLLDRLSPPPNPCTDTQGGCAQTQQNLCMDARPFHLISLSSHVS